MAVMLMEKIDKILSPRFNIFSLLQGNTASSLIWTRIIHNTQEATNYTLSKEMTERTKAAILVVDMQEDFCPPVSPSPIASPLSD